MGILAKQWKSKKIFVRLSPDIGVIAVRPMPNCGVRWSVFTPEAIVVF